MDKRSQRVTEDPRRAKSAPKGRENYMNKLKKSILSGAKRGSRDTSNASNQTTSATNTVTTPAKSTTNTATSDTYIYGVGILAVLVIGVCMFFAYNTSQAVNKN